MMLSVLLLASLVSLGTGYAATCAHASVATEAATTWPGDSSIYVASEEEEFKENLSGMFLNKDSVSGWAVNNDGILYKLKFSSKDNYWTSDTGDNWGEGKKMLYPDGTGQPDAEDITMAADDLDHVYVCTERNDTGDDSNISRMSILSYAVGDTGQSSTIVALDEWDLTKYLPTADQNEGLEAITWVPDSYLTAHKFIDESTGSEYEPDSYPDHGAGLFMVGLEKNGKVYAFALDHSGNSAAHLVTDFKTLQATVMSLVFDREVEYLWTLCDNTCDGQQEVYSIINGKFDPQGLFARPADMDNYNNEGFAVSSESACVGGLKPVYWVDDSMDNGFDIRGGTVKCGDFLNITSS
jgi:hypothetical protein